MPRTRRISSDEEDEGEPQPSTSGAAKKTQPRHQPQPSYHDLEDGGVGQAVSEAVFFVLAQEGKRATIKKAEILKAVHQGGHGRKDVQVDQFGKYLFVTKSHKQSFSFRRRS